MSDENVPLEDLSPLSEASLEDFEGQKKHGPKTREVCACGHSMNRHYQGSNGKWMCTPTRMYCGCSEAQPVLVADNLRLFLYQTTGWGRNHALGKGIVASRGAGAGYRWLTQSGEPECIFCGEVTDAPIPTAVHVSGRDANGWPITIRSSETAKKDVIACPSCARKEWETPRDNVNGD